jgi:hypothetical protein
MNGLENAKSRVQLFDRNLKRQSKFVEVPKDAADDDLAKTPPKAKHQC